MTSAIVQLIIYAVMAAGVAGTLGIVHHNIYEGGYTDGVATQVKLDGPKMAAIGVERDEWMNQERQREAEAVPLKAQLKLLSDANQKQGKDFENAKKNTAALLTQLDKVQSNDNREIARLKAIAAGKTTPNEAGADAILDDLVHRRMRTP